MAIIRINELPIETAPTTNEFLPIDGASTRKSTIQAVVNAGAPVASQEKAQAGVDNNDRMTALTTKQSISSEVGVTIASQANGVLASTAVQPSRQVIAGAGLTGGGDFSVDRVLNVGAGTGIDVTDSSVGLDAVTQSRLIPAGGSTGQVLAKTSATNYDTFWSSAGSGDVVGPNGGVSENFPVAFNTTTGKLIKAITGSIAALHGLTPAANKLPYFIGATSASLTDLTAFARTILDDANGAAMYATMGATLSTGGNGYTKLPNGFLIQWGFAANSGSQSNGSASFPINFPNGCFGVWPVRSATNAAAYSISINWGSGGFGWYDSGSSFPSFGWVAIGY